MTGTGLKGGTARERVSPFFCMQWNVFWGRLPALLDLEPAKGET